MKVLAPACDLPPDLARLGPDELRRTLDRVGETPLLSVTLLGMPLLLKLEGCNPGGSIKDRTALFMIRELERRGMLRAGHRLVDSTSGNFGVAMAWISRALGYRFTAITDPRVTEPNLRRMGELGATVEIMHEKDETGGYLLSRIRRAQAIAEGSAATVWVNQYSNPDNARSHELGIAPELVRQLRGDIGTIFVSASTGGTLAGVGRHLRQHVPAATVVAVDGEGSLLFGGAAGPRLVNGLGSSRPSDFLHRHLFDAVETVSAGEAFRCCRLLADMHGVRVGGSSGAAIAAALAWTQRRGPAAPVVCICPDHGSHYEDTLFSDEWLQAQRIELS